MRESQLEVAFVWCADCCPIQSHPTDSHGLVFLAFLPTGPADATPLNPTPTRRAVRGRERHCLQTQLRGGERRREIEVCFHGEAGLSLPTSWVSSSQHRKVGHGEGVCFLLSLLWSPLGRGVIFDVHRGR